MERKEIGFLNERAIVIPKDILNKNSLNSFILSDYGLPYLYQNSCQNPQQTEHQKLTSFNTNNKCLKIRHYTVQFLDTCYSSLKNNMQSYTSKCFIISM